MLWDLTVATLKIPDKLYKRLIEVVLENFDVFASTFTDLRRTFMVIHTINTGDKRPFCHKICPISFARRQYLRKKVDKLILIGAVFHADQGAYPYASRIVFTSRK